MEPRRKNPERVRLGRLGALELHARGRTNVGPARAAWEAKLRAEVGIDDNTPPDVAKRRAELAMRARMTRLAMARWAQKREAAGPDRNSGRPMEAANPDGEHPKAA